jgi:glycosyltransferase involved in cell wall biosynthesis
MDVSVIICAYTLERWDLLSQAIAAVHAQTHPAREVILVIDGNDELLKRSGAELPGTTVLANRHGDGSTGARRTGTEHARSTVLAFLDDDAIPDPQWLAEMAGAYDDPDVLGVGGFLEPLWLGDPPAWLAPEFYWIVGCTYAGMPVDSGRIRNPISANMSVRADVVARAGGMDPRLSRTHRGATVSGTAEETEFCIRAARLYPGGYWAYRPAARVRHAVPPERTTWRYFVGRCRLEAAAKAVLTEIAGRDDGLASERAYVRSVLPRAVVRELTAAVRGDRAGFPRAATIVAGLSITAFWYVVERVRSR